MQKVDKPNFEEVNDYIPLSTKILQVGPDNKFTVNGNVIFTNFISKVQKDMQLSINIMACVDKYPNGYGLDTIREDFNTYLSNLNTIRTKFI